jgi:hypothetical protein
VLPGVLILAKYYLFINFKTNTLWKKELHPESCSFRRKPSFACRKVT